MIETVARVAALGLALAAVEMLHGIARALFVAPRIGAARAKRWSIVTGSLLALAVCWWRVPGCGFFGTGQLSGLGLGLALFMALFDVAMARFVARQPWSVVVREFDLAHGNLLPIGLGVLLLAPWVVTRLGAGR